MKLPVLPNRRFWLLIAGGLLLVTFGCDSVRDYLSAKPTSGLGSAAGPQGSSPATQIIAQGTLRPLHGVLPLMAPPGDRVATVLVSAGDDVEAGQPLIELESYRARQIELKVAQTQLDEGEKRITAEIAVANAKQKVAEISLRQAENQLSQARERLKLATSSGGTLDLLRRAADLGQRKLDQLRNASLDPATTRLVSTHTLDEEQLKVSETRMQYENAKTEAEQSIVGGELAVEVARQEIIAATLAIQAAQANNPLDSLRQQFELLQLKADAAVLRSPMAARVLTVDAMVGQATGPTPLMNLADLSQMVCEVEVNVADLPQVAASQRAEIRSAGLSEPLTGVVERIEPMVAAPALMSPFPMAPVDRYTAKVLVRIDESDTVDAAMLIQLQVEVTIMTGGEDRSSAIVAPGTAPVIASTDSSLRN